MTARLPTLAEINAPFDAEYVRAVRRKESTEPIERRRRAAVKLAIDNELAEQRQNAIRERLRRGAA